MSASDDLRAKVCEIFGTAWTRKDGRVVPEPKDIGLGNDGIDLDATVLYADLVESTALVRNTKDVFAADVYKTYLYCACYLIRESGGAITSFDGDRVMGIFLGAGKEDSAVTAALKINFAVGQIINPSMKKYWPTDYVVKQAIGIDSSKILAARTGVRGDNDVVWVGNAANRAAKLCALRAGYPTVITNTVFGALANSLKSAASGSFWYTLPWPATGENVYVSNAHYVF